MLGWVRDQAVRSGLAVSDSPDPPEVESRLPEGEVAPEPQPGEYVVFLAHFERGFGLPASPFFCDFLDTYDLQPHHLPANAIMMLSVFTTYAEAYLGICPFLDLWAKYFILRRQAIPNPDKKIKDLVDCGAATIIPRADSGFPIVKGLESCRKWQRSFFYVKNREHSGDGPGSSNPDFINLPEFVIGPPREFRLWKKLPDNEEVNCMHDVLHVLNQKMTGDDLLRCFIVRRVCPLQNRVHKMCHMAGNYDPTRTSILGLNHAGVVRRVRAIARTEMTEDYSWGVIGGSRKKPCDHCSYLSFVHSPSYMRSPGHRHGLICLRSCSSVNT